MTAPPLALGSLFPIASREEWLALVDRVLDGAPFDRRLVSRTYDGLAIQPLYTAADAAGSAGLPGTAPFTRGNRAGARSVDGWLVRQTYAHPALAEANAAILADLEAGVQAIRLRIGPGGIPVGSAADLATALAGVHLDAAPFWLDAGAGFADAAAWLADIWSNNEIPDSAAVGCFGADPLGARARLGAPPDLAAAAALAAALCADATVYGEAGAADATEVGFALATGVAYLRAATEAGMTAASAAAQLTVALSVTADQFAGIAKLRAFRRCWARVAEASGLGAEDRSVPVEAVTSAAIYSRRDPWVNLLRGTLAAFAAGAGGADAVTVLPFDTALGVPSDDGLRLARNTQTILLEESHLAQVTDPAGGSWYVEARSEALATAAWAEFQAVEAEGGMAAALASGWAAARVEATWNERYTNLARRKDALTGISEFPNVDEQVPARTAAGPVDDAAGGFPLRRLAAPFEALRDAADRAATPPAIFLANLGPEAVHTARATFAKNFFEAGGVRAVGNDGFATAAEAGDAFAASGCQVAVICSSDRVYAEEAIPAAGALKAAGAAAVYLAGNPGDQRDRFRDGGIDDFVFLGSDAIATLQTVHARLGL
jgi:methylmalonyl-CoA mutase